MADVKSDLPPANLTYFFGPKRPKKVLTEQKSLEINESQNNPMRLRAWFMKGCGKVGRLANPQVGEEIRQQFQFGFTVQKASLLLEQGRSLLLSLFEM